MGKTTTNLKNRLKALRTSRENAKKVVVDNSKQQQLADIKSKIINCEIDLKGMFKGNEVIQAKLDSLLELKTKLEKEIENERNNTNTVEIQ